MNMRESVLGKSAAVFVLGLTLAACSVWSGAEPELVDTSGSTVSTRPEVNPTSTPIPLSALPDLGPAPEIENSVWLNSDQPLRLADMAGKVVLLEFWTYG
jgi:hypothetical protein